MTIQERIQTIVDKLFNGNKNQFAKAINEAPTSVNNILGSRQSVPSAKFLESIINSIEHINAAWLLAEVGNMLTTQKQEEAAPIQDEHIMMVPLVNQYAQAGYMMGWADVAYIETLPKIPWIVDKEYKGKYISFEVRGDSMDDGMKHSYEQGDILLCREIGCDYWKSKLHFNAWDAFVIVHKTDGIVLKQIVDHDVENGIITCHSFNPIYPDFKVDLRDIAQLFNVVKQQKNK